jgi:hypothetical protein
MRTSNGFLRRAAIMKCMSLLDRLIKIRERESLHGAYTAWKMRGLASHASAGKEARALMNSRLAQPSGHRTTRVLLMTSRKLHILRISDLLE